MPKILVILSSFPPLDPLFKKKRERGYKFLKQHRTVMVRDWPPALLCAAGTHQDQVFRTENYANVDCELG